MLTSPSSPLIQSSPVYIGRIFYDSQGQVLGETGHDLPQTADQRITAMEKQLVGKWAFSLLKTKRRSPTGGDEWASAVVFPDGKSRRLVTGEVAATTAKSKGVWINHTMALKALNDAKVRINLRLAPDVRFPWQAGSATCRLEKFDNMLAFEKWVQSKIAPGAIFFIVNPAANNLPPDEEALFAYLAVVTA